MRTITGPVTKTGILADARTIRLGGTTTISTASANTAGMGGTAPVCRISWDRW